MTCVVDVFCENYTLIDWDLHSLWIEGRSVTEAVAIMREKGILNEYPGVTQDLLVSDLNDHYRLFSMLDALLLKVGNYSEQKVYQLNEETQRTLIERYYSLDDSFCRELVGKKLSTRLRKDLDEVAEKAGVLLKSARRQFDNIKRVFKSVEEMPGSYVGNIVKTFCLSEALAKKYAAIVFLGSFRFELGKKRLNYLGFEAITRVALLLIDGCWMIQGADTEPSLNKEFLSSLKILKTLLDRDKEHRNIVCSRLKELSEHVSTKSYSEIESNFKLITRNLLQFGQGKTEIKDFFVYLVEKIAEPLKSMQLERKEIELFLSAYTEAVTDNVLLVDNSDGLGKMLEKYMATLTPCILAVY